MTREAIETVINEGVFAANGMRKILVKFATSRTMYRAGFGRNPSGLANLLTKCEYLGQIQHSANVAQNTFILPC